MPRQTSPKDRRKWERLPLAVPMFVRGRDQGGQEFLEFATALNVSAGGALVAVGRRLPVPSKVALEVPSAPQNGHGKLPRAARRLLAKLVHVQLGAGCQLLGVKFSTPLLRAKRRNNSSPV